MAKLFFKYGSMNSGKSTKLLQTAFNYEERDLKVQIIKPKIDTKGNGKIKPRLKGLERDVDNLISPEDNILDIVRDDIACLLVDEVQFLKKEQIDQLFEIAVLKDIAVICYGLRTDFLTNGFEGSERLLLLAHEITEEKTICRCGKKAVLNARKIDGKITFEGEQVEIDDSSNIEYEAMCGKCYLKEKYK